MGFLFRQILSFDRLKNGVSNGNCFFTRDSDYAIAPAPEGVASATMESLYNIFFVLGCKVNKSKLVLILK
jgi:hypothetical protein